MCTSFHNSKLLNSRKSDNEHLFFEKVNMYKIWNRRILGHMRQFIETLINKYNLTWVKNANKFCCMYKLLFISLQKKFSYCCAISEIILGKYINKQILKLSVL